MNDEEQFLKAFEECSLRFDQWTHRAHVRVAYLYLQKYPFEQASDCICKGIRRYNAFNKVPEGPASGYNETTTRAFVHLIAATASAYKNTHRVDSAEAFCDMHPQLMTKHILRLFYSPARRMDPLAKSTFVPPDLAPLPKIIQE